MTQTKSHIPKIRFKEFSGELEEKVFSSVYEFVGSNSYSRDCLNYEDGEIKNIHYGDIHTKFKSNFILKNEKVPFINSDIDLSKLTEEKYCKKGDLVIADASEDYKDIGKSIELIDLDNKKVLAGLHTFIARPKENKIALGFGGYLMTNFNVHFQIMTIAVGAKVLGISKTNLGNIQIFLPSFQEQQQIASFLSSVDKKIEKIKEKKKNLEEYKKGVMQNIFSQEIRFKDDNGKEFGDWEEKKLGEIGKLQGGFAFKSEEFKKSGIPIIKISNISNNNNYIDLSNIIYYDEINNDENYIIKNGDLIIAMSGATTGKSSIYNLKEKAYLNQRVGLFKANLNKLNYGFLIQFVFSDLFYKQLDGVLVAGAQPNISGKDIEKFIINLPTLKEQEKIADFLSGIDEKIEKVNDELEKMEEFKKGLLQGMFV